jgi:hypothetical protein
MQLVCRYTLAYDPEKKYSTRNPNKKHRWLILPLLALQALVLRPALTKTIRKDIKAGKVARKYV